MQPQNIHVTIRFLGEITRPIIEDVQQEMTAVTFRPFEVRLQGVGVFPHLKRPRVVWIGIAQGDKELRDIHSQLEPRLRALGLPADDKGFSPHITIARVRSGRNREELSTAIGEMNQIEIGELAVTKVALKRSVLTPHGPVYSTLYEKHAEPR